MKEIREIVQSHLKGVQESVRNEEQGLFVKAVGHCEKHGDFTYSYPKAYPNVWAGCPVCEQEKKISKLFYCCAIPPRFKDKTFENYICEIAEQKSVLNNCRAFAKKILSCPKEKRGNLLLIGSTGTGKTHLACAIARVVMQGGKSALFLSAYDLSMEMRASLKATDRSEQDVIEEFTEPFLLILDEVGTMLSTEYEKKSLFNVLNARYNYFRPTILISNENIETISNAIGSRLFDRLRENGAVLSFSWTSFRRK